VSFFVPTVRISIVIALCCSGAFADTHPRQIFSTVRLYGSKVSDAQQASENKLENLAMPQLSMLMPKLTDRSADSALYPEQNVINLPDIQFVPENKSGELALPQLGSLTPSLAEHTERDDGALPAPEPFNLTATAVQQGDVPARWAELQSRMLADERALATCSAAHGPCPTAAQRLLSIVELGRKREGRARLGWINRAINVSIRPMSDWAQYGYAQFWATPLQTLSSGAGDCKDYAIVKYAALRELGVAPSDLRLVIVRDNLRQAEHEVLAVRDEQKWLILDNLTMAMLDAEQIRHYYPLFVMDYRGARAFTAMVARR
jgi:predicted transglutaminase-like cysteine proteinase